MYERHLGDDLCKDDPRLKYEWDWSRIASGYNTNQLKKWTHFQTSECEVGKWTLEAIQWGADHVYYTAEIQYIGHTICSVGRNEEDILTRVDAQVRAEQLLIDWITEEYNLTSQYSRPDDCTSDKISEEIPDEKPELPPRLQHIQDMIGAIRFN